MALNLRALKSDKKYNMFPPVDLWMGFDIKLENTQIKCFWKSVAENVIRKFYLKNSPNVGLEPTTVGLRVQRSTDWASRAWMIYFETRIYIRLSHIKLESHPADGKSWQWS